MENYSCKKCNIIFATKSSLERHMNKKIQCDIKTQFQCNKCNKYFRQKNNLIQHTENKLCKSVSNPINNIIINNININPVRTIMEILNNNNISLDDKIYFIKKINNTITNDEIILVINSNLNIESKITLLNIKSKIVNKVDSVNNQNSEYINLTNVNTTSEDSNLVSYIYLIQEREHVLNNNNVYKFGRTTQTPENKINRLTRYKRGSNILLILECPNDKVLEIESKIRIEFKKKFEPHIDGHEHFKGNWKQMSKIIIEITDTVENS